MKAATGSSCVSIGQTARQSRVFRFTSDPSKYRQWGIPDCGIIHRQWFRYAIPFLSLLPALMLAGDAEKNAMEKTQQAKKIKAKTWTTSCNSPTVFKGASYKCFVLSITIQSSTYWGKKLQCRCCPYVLLFRKTSLLFRGHSCTQSHNVLDWLNCHQHACAACSNRTWFWFSYFVDSCYFAQPSHIFRFSFRGA